MAATLCKRHFQKYARVRTFENAMKTTNDFAVANLRKKRQHKLCWRFEYHGLTREQARLIVNT